ncbi:MAG TPA: DUF3037 domain-containing protein [Flavobacteriales bacterium]
MQGRHLYEYAVIRVLPVPEREEFVNVGVIVLCKSADRIQVRTLLNEERVLAFDREADLEPVRANLRSLERIASGDPQGGPIARLDAPSRFRWLTAVRSSAIQTSRPHPGTCTDLDEVAERLFRELVL